MLESQLLASVRKRLDQLAKTDETFTYRKRHGSPLGHAGDPDLYGLWNGVHWEIELKVPGQNPTPLQIHRLEQWRRSGALTFVVHSLPELDEALHTIPLNKSV